MDETLLLDVSSAVGFCDLVNRRNHFACHQLLGCNPARTAKSSAGVENVPHVLCTLLSFHVFKCRRFAWNEIRFRNVKSLQFSYFMR